MGLLTDATAKFRNTGQTCVAANRVFVQDGIYDKFAKALSKTISTFKIGPGTQVPPNSCGTSGAANVRMLIRTTGRRLRWTFDPRKRPYESPDSH
jgi:hypothetical protein